MKKELFRFTDIGLALGREVLKKIKAGGGKTSGTPASRNSPWNGGMNQTDGQRKERKPLSLLEAYKKLSLRECEVLDKMAEGKTNREIAGELFITKSTVEDHICNIGNTLGLSGRGRVRKWVARQKKRG